MATVRIAAPAKVNLRLEILAREEGGYHGLETVFCAVSLADELVVEEAEPGVALEVGGGVEVGPADDNLVVRAARRFYAELGREPAVRLRLQKRIPSAAGLGGGSSDAAATLRALNALHGDPLERATLLQCAIELGADVPFFLCGSPLALAWSRGERLLALPPLPPRPVLIAHPGEPIPTAGAFREIAARRGGEYRPRAHALDAAQLASWEAVAALAGNDFQPLATERVPRVGAGLEALRRGGARIALLAGSGSSIFGVFAPGAELDGPERALRELGFATWRAATLPDMPTPTAG